jgi:succinate dehydrogenase / fumarate reductase flavoprotein subunit
VTNYLGTHAQELLKKVDTHHPAFESAEKQVRAGVQKLLETGKKGKRTPTEIYRDLGRVVWEKIGMARSEQGLKEAMQEIEKLQHDFDTNLLLTGDDRLNKNLEMAGRLSDFLELAYLMAQDALHRKESCGGHFRVESQTPEGEAQRDDGNFAYVAAWEYQGKGQASVVHKEPLVYENVKLSVRSYK